MAEEQTDLPETQTTQETPTSDNIMKSLWGLVDEDDSPSTQAEEAVTAPRPPKSLKEMLDSPEEEVQEEEVEEVVTPEEKPEPEPEKKPVRIIKKTAPPAGDPDYTDTLPEFKPKQPEVEDQPDWSEFSEDEQDKLEVARFAATHMKDKYPELDTKLSEYFKKHREFVEEKSTEDPDYDFSEGNPEYKKFLEKNKPKFTQVDYKRIERQKIIHEVSSQKDAEIGKLQEEIRRTKEAPDVDKKVQTFTEQLKSEVLPDEIAKLKDEAKAREEFPLEFEIVDQVLQDVSESSKLFLRISRQLEPFDRTNPNHMKLAQDVEQIGQDFFKNGGKTRIQGGKQFLPRSRFRQAYEAGQSDKYWTFTDEQVLDRMKQSARKNIQSRVDAERARLEKYGYSRKAKKEEKPKPEEDGKPPRAKPSRSPGPSGGDPTPGDERRILSNLGF